LQPGRGKSTAGVPLPAPLEIHPVQPTPEPLCLTSPGLNGSVLQVVAKPRLYCLPSTLGLGRAFSAPASSVPQLLGLLELERASKELFGSYLSHFWWNQEGAAIQCKRE